MIEEVEKQWVKLDSDNEQMSSSDSSSENHTSTTKRFKSEQEKGAKIHCHGDSISCRLQQRITQSCVNYPLACKLLSAHLQAHQAARGTSASWVDILFALTKFTNGGISPNQGDYKTFVRLNRGSSIVSRYQNIWSDSVKRFQQRLADYFHDLAQKKELRRYRDTLNTSEGKAFNACVQLWRKTLKDSSNIDKVKRQSDFICDSIDASLLLRRDDSAALIICANKSQDALQSYSIVVESPIDAQEWKVLEVCADGGEQIRSILQGVLSRYKAFSTLNIATHCYPNHKDQSRTVASPPILLECDALLEVGNEAWEREWESYWTELDYKHVVKILLRDHEVRDFSNQPARCASLSILTSAVVQREALDKSTLPYHLRKSVETVVRCTSCSRYMAHQTARDGHDELSTRFKEQARMAGFKIRRAIINEMLSSLSDGKSYLPPLVETFQFHNLLQKSTTTILIGDPSTSKGYKWQFCSFCAALHFRLIPSDISSYCRCIACTRERNTTTKSSQPLFHWQRPLLLQVDNLLADE